MKHALIVSSGLTASMIALASTAAQAATFVFSDKDYSGHQRPEPAYAAGIGDCGGQSDRAGPGHRRH